jgi:hypothetical protein
MISRHDSESIEDILRGLICISAARVFWKVLVQRNLMERMRNRDGWCVMKENIDEGRGVEFPDDLLVGV